MPKINTDKEALHVLAIEIGLRNACRKLGINESTGRSWSKRLGWHLKPVAAAPVSPLCNESRALRAATSATSPSEILVAMHKEHETATKSSLARATSRAAAEAEQLPQVLPHSGKLRDLAATAAGLFGWNNSGVTVNAQQALVVTTEQLEQIRALRGT